MATYVMSATQTLSIFSAARKFLFTRSSAGAALLPRRVVPLLLLPPRMRPGFPHQPCHPFSGASDSEGAQLGMDSRRTVGLAELSSSELLTLFRW